MNELKHEVEVASNVHWAMCNAMNAAYDRGDLDSGNVFWVEASRWFEVWHALSECVVDHIRLA